MLDPRQLVVLREVARTGSFSEAARALGYTQPAISQQVRALERRTGTALLVRSGRRSFLTEAGEVLVRHSAAIIGTLEAAEDELAAIAGLQKGRVRLAAFPSGSATLVPKAIAKLRASHPGVRVSLVEMEPPGSLDLVRRGECEIAVAFHYPGVSVDVDADLAQIPLQSDALMAVLPKGHPLAEHERVRLEELADEEWIAGCPRCRGHLLQACAEAGFVAKITFETDDSVAVQSLVGAGLGVALLPRLILSAVRNPRVVTKPLDPEPQREIMAVTVPDQRRVAAVAAMLTALEAAAASA